MLAEGVSIIICCYNSAKRLPETIRHLAEQKFIGHWEIIIVNNRSNDDTGKVAKIEWHKYALPNVEFKVVDEQKPGLNYARKKGTETSNYECLIFCDDDNWLHEDYVKNALSLLKSNPRVAILGGIGTAEFEGHLSKPPWFDNFYHGYAIGAQADKESKVNSVYGAGMVVRKSVINMVTGKHPLFLHGRKLNQLTAGDDAEMCMRVRLAGYDILYSPQLKFKHFLPDNRLKWDYLKKLYIGFAKTHVAINLYEKVLNSQSATINPFYWLKKGLYYWGIYLKYWPKHYSVYKKGEGTIGEIHHLTWKNIAVSYFEYNIKTVIIFREITALKNQISRSDQNEI